jgi:hypothetical protein
MNKCAEYPNSFYYVAIFLILACGTGESHHSKQLPGHCRITLNGQSLFVGERECFAALPQTEIAGYWVVDHEYSVLYSSRPSIKLVYDQDATWLDLSIKAQGAVTANLVDGRRQIFEIKFMGVRSYAPGVYGNGTFKSGAYVDEVISLKEVGAR